MLNSHLLIGVYYSLRTAGRLVGSEVSEAAVRCAEHRLGPVAGQATRDGLGALADVHNTD